MRRLAGGMAIFGIAFVALSWAVAGDTEIAREITEKLKYEKEAGRLQDFDINLQVTEGTVLMKGHVASQEQQQLAVDVARQIQGVKQVVNDLQIGSATAAQDRQIADAIARELSKHKQAGRLKGFHINIDVTDGAATLKGSVASEEQKKLAQESAANTPGVCGVVDQLAVDGPSNADTPAISDAEIARQIASALKQHQNHGELKGFAIDMTVQDGIVTYTGHVSNEQQIALALEAAHSVEGVKDIVSKLAVSEEDSADELASSQSTPQVDSLAAEPIWARESDPTPAIPKLEPQPVASPEPQRAETRSTPSTVAEYRAEPANLADNAKVENAIYRREADELAMRDQQIGAELMQLLQKAKQDGQLRGFGIGVHVHQAQVRLTGRVSSREQQQMAIDLARDIRGVKKVVNELTIAEPSLKQSTEGSLASDRSITAVAAATPLARDSREEGEALRIAQTLGAQLQRQEALGKLSGCDFDVKLDGTKVTLTGRVTSPEQERLILEVARQVPGVREVEGDLEIVPQTTATQTTAVPVSVQSPAYATAAVPTPGYIAYPAGPMPVDQGALMDQTPRPVGAARMVAYAGAAAVAAPLMAMNQIGGGAPAHLPGPGHAVVPARYDHPYMPGYAWPSYAAYPNYAAVTYPKQYSPTAWPYIGPFYPYPQVPLGWRKVTLKWDDGWWQLNFKSK